jgi:hypothetical protein
MNDSIKKYLVYVETGGGIGDYTCSNMFYTIVNGIEGASLIEKWCSINEIAYKKITFNTHNNCWLVDGYLVRVVELIESFDRMWKQLIWKPDY